MEFNVEEGMTLQANQFVQFTQNIGPSHNYGAEFDLSTRLTRELFLGASFGVTKAVQAGISIPISIVTLTAELDHSTNSVQSVKLVFAPPPKKL